MGSGQCTSCRGVVEQSWAVPGEESRIHVTVSGQGISRAWDCLGLGREKEDDSTGFLAWVKEDGGTELGLVWNRLGSRCLRIMR